MKSIAAAFRERAWWQQILVITLAAIVYIEFFGYVGTRLLVPIIGWDDGIQPAGAQANTLQGRFVRMDSGYYMLIAEHGYQPNGVERAFFPLYPVLASLVHDLLHIPLMWSGLLISLACFVAACLIMYQWVLVDYDPPTALWSVAWICIFPMAFFFVAFYAEALFLLTCVASIYFARKGSFVASGLCIALAGATRPLAFLLGVPFALEFLQQRNLHRTHTLRFILGGLIAPMGVLAYFAFLGVKSHTLNIFAAYASIQSASWKRFITWPWITLFDGARAAVFGTGITSDWFARALAWQDLSYAILGVVLAAWATFKARLSTGLFMLASMVFIYADHGPYGDAFWSVPRFVAAVFPIYLVLGIWTTRLPYLARRLLPLVSLFLLGLLAAWFASGRWVA